MYSAVALYSLRYISDTWVECIKYNVSRPLVATLQLFRNGVSRSVGSDHLAGLVCCLRYIDRRRYYLLSTPFSERLQVVSMEQWIGHI